MAPAQPKKARRIVLPPDEYKALCKRVMTRDGWRCRNPQCKSRDSLHCHHVIFRSQQGDDSDKNMVTVCHNCHDKIHGTVKGILLIVKAIAGATIANANVGLRFVTEETECEVVVEPAVKAVCPLKTRTRTSPKPSPSTKKK